MQFAQLKRQKFITLLASVAIASRAQQAGKLPRLGVLLSLLALALGAPLLQEAAAQGPKVWKVGILWHAANLAEEQVMFGPFSEGMRDLGYVEGRNVIYDHTFVDENYDLFPARAQELVNRRVDVILASVPAAATAAARLTKTIPIVFAT